MKRISINSCQSLQSLIEIYKEQFASQKKFHQHIQYKIAYRNLSLQVGSSVRDQREERLADDETSRAAHEESRVRFPIIDLYL